MLRALFAFVLLLSSLTLAHANDEPVTQLSDTRTADEIDILDQVSAYLNQIDTLQARFTQIASDGSFAEGTVYIRRPGSARFDYDHADVSIIANGIWLAIWDRDLEYVDRLPLWDTPLSVLLEEDTDLATDHDKLGIEGVTRGQGVIRVTVYEKGAPENGNLTLVFEEGPMILRRWDAIDATGQTTSVSIFNVEVGLPLERRLFRIPNI